MSPLDRIAQLNARMSELEAQVLSLETANALMRSQLTDGQEQAKRDSATIQKLGNHKVAFASILADSAFLLSKIGNNWREAGSMSDSCKRAGYDAREILRQYPTEADTNQPAR